MLHIALYARFQGPSSGVSAHIFLAEFDLQRGFRVRQSFIARDGGQWFGRAYHLLDDVSAVKHVSV
jgi:hypothetical protein